MKMPDSKQSGPVPDPCVVELRKMLQSVLGENFVRLYHYGSRVDGGADPESDYDVLCVTKRTLNQREMDEVLDRRIDLHLTYDVFFDLHFFLDEEIKSPPVECLPFLQHAVVEGMVV
ncbi:MAG: nucleotidyltransferase domain-containing protein [Thermoguttaceae bacterium]